MIRLGLFAFQSRSAAVLYLKQMRSRYDDQQPLDALDRYLVARLYATSPRKERRGVVVGAHLSPAWGYPDQRSFKVRFADGTEDEFSYLKALGKGDFYEEAARATINEWRHTFKKTHLRRHGNLWVCPVCQRATYYNQIDVHHEPPNTWPRILEMWPDHRWEWSNGKRVLVAASAFVAFHAERATLALACKPCHRRLHRGACLEPSAGRAAP